MSIEERIKHKDKETYKKLQKLRHKDFERMMKDNKGIDESKCKGRY